MRMIICGMGEVGRHLAAELASTGHDVVAIDTSRDVLTDVEEVMDVLTLRGHAGLPTTLQKAGAAKAELVAAVTNHDEVNLVVALAAKQLGAKVTVARLSNHDYFPDRTGWYEGMLGVDLSLCPGLLAGAEVVRLSRAGRVDHIEHFAGHLIQLAVITLDESMPAINRAASQLNLGDDCRVLAVIRDDATEPPESIVHLQPDDQVIVAGPSGHLHKADKLFREGERRKGRAIVVGGGRLGGNVAQELLSSMDVVTLAERHEATCIELAERLDGVDIERGSGTSRPFLEELDVGHVHTFVATTGDDEVNLMATLLSKQLGAEQAIALVQRPDYAAVYADLGIDYTVSPRLLVSAEILRFLNRRRAAREHRIPTDGSLVIEHQISEQGHLLGKRLLDMELPHGVIPVAVVRGRDILSEPELVRLEARDVIVIFSPERSAAGTRRALLRS